MTDYRPLTTHRLRLLGQLLLGGSDDVLDGEAELFLEFRQRRGSSEASHADRSAGRAISDHSSGRQGQVGESLHVM